MAVVNTHYGYCGGDKLPGLAGTWVLNQKPQAPESVIDELLSTPMTVKRSSGSTFAAKRITISLTTITLYPTTGGSSAIYSFQRNEWYDSGKTWIFPDGSTASDEFRTWLASNATKQS